TELVTAARTNDPRVVAALAEQFPEARLHLPLTTLDGVRNRPETALELGRSLPLHWLRLDTGLSAVAVFTNLELCRKCAKALDWKTDGKAIKTLPLPGSVALSYLKELLMYPEVDRVIVNPLSEGALHLARTEVEAIAAGQPLRTLWLYARNGGLNRPVEIEGGSLLNAILAAATRAVPREAELVIETSPKLESLPGSGPLAPLAAELYKLLYPDMGEGEGVELVLTRSSDGVRIEATPVFDAHRLLRVKAIAEKHLADAPRGTRVGLRMDKASVTISSTQSATPATRKEPELGYIPLEPEAPSDEKPR
ncbi:MAG TPA: hypothetical protein VIE88_07465, partial [Vicinamibacteria bacterium]